MKSRDERIVDLYQSGLTAVEVGDRVGYRRSTVYSVLRNRGIAVRPRGSGRKHDYVLPKEKWPTVQRLYRKGMPGMSIAAKFGVSWYTIKTALRAGGVKINGRGNRERRFTPAEVERILKLRAAGTPQSCIARRMKSSQIKISRELRSRGIETKPSGSRHPCWKGGRITLASGYVGVMVSQSDALASMRNSAGYVAEHRLVMARELKRALMPGETVHHIDGNKANNEIGNLQLRVGKHGDGVCFRCADCGSPNVIPIGL